MDDGETTAMTTALDAPVELARTELFIGGQTRTTDRYLPIIDPARPNVVVGESAAASEAQAHEAVAAAAAAFPGWSARTAKERADAMVAATSFLDPPPPDLIRLLTLENGKIQFESMLDIADFGRLFQMTAALADEVDESTSYASPFSATTVGRLPLGVVTIILPFNWPLAILGASLPLALLAGNTVIVKPPFSAPLATVRAVERIADALPPGVLNIITGEDQVIGTPLIQNEAVAKVCFTGSVGGGRRIMAMAAQTLTRVTLELGGNDPALVLDDAQLDDTNLNQLFGSVFASTGQICMAVKRLYVHRSRYDDVVDGLSQRLSQVHLGHGLDSDTTMGPLHQRRQRDYVKQLVEGAAAAGAEVREFTELPDEPRLTDGNFLRPSLVLDPDQTLPLVTEEQFGPTVPVIPYDNEADAVAAANSGWAGLGASVWSGDEERGRQVASLLRAGYCWVNAHGAPFVDRRAPFGGLRASGMGREFGIEGVREFQDLRSLTTVNHGSQHA
jgi:acyl-CoA reductase-like NAD-dependent aldehyde dehydrogenase